MKSCLVNEKRNESNANGTKLKQAAKQAANNLAHIRWIVWKALFRRFHVGLPCRQNTRVRWINRNPKITTYYTYRGGIIIIIIVPKIMSPGLRFTAKYNKQIFEYARKSHQKVACCHVSLFRRSVSVFWALLACSWIRASGMRRRVTSIKRNACKIYFRRRTHIFV